MSQILHTDASFPYQISLACSGDGTFAAVLWSAYPGFEVACDRTTGTTLILCLVGPSFQPDFPYNTTSSAPGCDTASLTGSGTFPPMSYGGHSIPPVVGDFIFEMGIELPGSRKCCTPCHIPRQDLTLSWDNTISGPGTDTITYSGGSWTSGCVNELIFALSARQAPIGSPFRSPIFSLDSSDR